MIPALRHLQRLLVALADDAIHQPVFLIDPPRPPARQIAAQRFGLAGALERVAAAFFDQGVEFFEQLFVMRPQFQILGPGS